MDILGLLIPILVCAGFFAAARWLHAKGLRPHDRYQTFGSPQRRVTAHTAH